MYLLIHHINHFYNSYPQNAGYTLPTEVDRWEDDNNAIVTVAKEMSRQLQNMADFTRQTGPITVRFSIIIFYF